MPAFRGVRLRINHAQLTAVVGPISAKAVQRAADATERRVRANIITDDLVNSGAMLNQVQQRPVPSTPPLFTKIAIGSPVPHVKYQEYGTRAHGPVKAKSLRFRPKGSDRVVFAKWVRGVRPRRFMQRALDQLRPTDFE